MWIQESFYKYSIAVLISLTIVLLLYLTSPIFYPLLWFVAAILLPILFATLLYYIFRPIVIFFERWVPRYLAIMATYFLFACLAITFGLYIVPEIIDTINNISPEKIEFLKTSTSSLIDYLKGYVPLTNIPIVESAIATYVPKINGFIYAGAANLIKTIADIAIALALTPFVLYYFLKDDKLFSVFLLRFVPEKFKDEVHKIIQDIDQTLSEFIIAQMTVACVVGFILFCGYLIIGLPQALGLALFAMVFYIIPFLGTFIAIIPALIVASTISFTMVFYVVLLMILAHLTESNLLTPKLMSIRLKIHPLTVVLLLLAAGSLYGLVGLLLVTPTYAILKVIIWNLYKISRLHYAMAKNNTSTEVQSNLP